MIDNFVKNELLIRKVSLLLRSDPERKNPSDKLRNTEKSKDRLLGTRDQLHKDWGGQCLQDVMARYGRVCEVGQNIINIFRVTLKSKAVFTD